MNLAQHAVRGIVASGKIEIGLAVRGVEIRTNGYTRQPADRWTVSGSTAQAEVTFGPFLARADFDAGLLIIDGDIVVELPTADGRADSVAPGSRLAYSAVLVGDSPDIPSS